MRSLFILVMLLFAMSIGLSAQDEHPYDVIKAENADQLIKLRSWTSNDYYRFPNVATFSPDSSELAIFINDGRLEFVSPETLDIIRTVEGIETEAQQIHYSADGRELLLSRRTGEYTLIDVESGAIIAANPPEEDPSYIFTPTPDVRKYVLTAFQVDGVSVRDTVTREELLYIPDADGYMWRVNDDATLLLTRHRGAILQVWDIATGDLVFELPPPENALLDGAGFTPHGFIWTSYEQFSDAGFTGSVIQFHNMETGEIVLELEGSEAYRSLIFDPTMSYVIANGIFTCHSWNLSTLAQLPCPLGGNYWGVFSPDGQLFVRYNASDYNIGIFGIGERLDRLATLQTDPTWYVEFSSDGRFLITIDWNVHLWAVPSATGR